MRQFPQTDRYLRADKWLEKPYPLTGTLRDRKVGILGLGRIGKAIAKRLDAFGVPVVYHGRTEQKDVAYRYYPSLVEMAKDVNVLLIVAPVRGPERGSAPIRTATLRPPTAPRSAATARASSSGSASTT